MTRWLHTVNFEVVMVHFKALFRHLLQEIEEIAAADIPDMKHHFYHPMTFTFRVLRRGHLPPSCRVLVLVQFAIQFLFKLVQSMHSATGLSNVVSRLTSLAKFVFTKKGKLHFSVHTTKNVSIRM
jgi:hypothetical protein